MNIYDLIATKLEPIDTDGCYREMLDDAEPIIICGLEYSPSVTFERVDPVAYRSGLVDYIDSMLDDNWCEINGNYYDAAAVNEMRDEMESEIAALEEEA